MIAVSGPCNNSGIKKKFYSFKFWRNDCVGLPAALPEASLATSAVRTFHGESSQATLGSCVRWGCPPTPPSSSCEDR